MDDWVKACRNLGVADSGGRGRSRMTWRARLDRDMKDIGLKLGMAMNREKWRCGIMGERLTRISAEITGPCHTSCRSSILYFFFLCLFFIFAIDTGFLFFQFFPFSISIFLSFLSLFVYPFSISPFYISFGVTTCFLPFL